MPTAPLTAAHRLLLDAADALVAAAGPDASEEELLSVLVVAVHATRRLDQLMAATAAHLERRGTFDAPGRAGRRAEGGAVE